jgi:hypothetical protein
MTDSDITQHNQSLVVTPLADALLRYASQGTARLAPQRWPENYKLTNQVDL